MSSRTVRRQTPAASWRTAAANSSGGTGMPASRPHGRPGGLERAPPCWGGRVHDATSAPARRRYIALGDSFTEGLSDPDPQRPAAYRGWADRPAGHLAAAIHLTAEGHRRVALAAAAALGVPVPGEDGWRTPLPPREPRPLAAAVAEEAA